MLSARLDSDRSMAIVNTPDKACNIPQVDLADSYKFLNGLHFISVLCISISANLFIMLFSLFLLHLGTSTDILQRIVSIINSRPTLLWSTLTTLFAVNVSFFISELYFLFGKNEFKSWFPLLLTYIPTYICVFIELVVIVFYFSKLIHISMHVFSITNHYFVRAIHAVVLSSSLWFAHRLWNCFLISIYFIAADPAPTIAVITLLVCTIVIAIAALASIYQSFHAQSRWYTKVLLTIVLLLMIFSLASVVIFLSFILVILIAHGLSANEIGTIVLSLTIPFEMGLVSYFITRFLDRIHRAASNGNQQESSEHSPLLGDNNVGSN